MNNETNYEFVDRDYDSVVNGNEKKIQFYSRTFDAIHEKYKGWRYNRLMKKKIKKDEEIKKYANVAKMASIGAHNQEIVKRKLAKLQDQVEYLNLALEDEQYLRVSVRLLKVAERARNSISRWWKDFVKNIPVVGKFYQQKMDARDKPSDVQNTESVSEEYNVYSDDVISPQTVEKMINEQFEKDNSEEQKKDADDSNIEQEDTTYRFGRDELANMPGRIDVINPAYDNESESKNDQGDSEKVETGIIPAELNTSLIIPNEFTVNFEQSNDKSNDNNVEDNPEINNDTVINSNASIASSIDEQDSIAELERYREILKQQIEKKKQMALRKEKARQEYEQAQEKNNKARDENNYLKEMFSTRLNMMEANLNEESQKTQEELDLMCDKTNKLNSNTNQLGQANESLKAMCDELNDELNIGAQKNTTDNSKGGRLK